MLLEGKVVIVTGASRGIGRAVAIGCAREGADVVVNDLSGPSAEVVEEIRALGRRAVPAQGDVADPETGKRTVARAVDAFGKLNVLVSNAGICPFHTFLDMPADVMRRTNEVNYYGTFYVAQAAANQMVAQGKGGAIVAMSSISALVGGGMQTHYTPTKAAIHSLMQSCAIALALMASAATRFWLAPCAPTSTGRTSRTPRRSPTSTSGSPWGASASLRT